MSFVLPPLPYDYDALKPHMSERTLHCHYDKHHKGYVDKLNQLSEGTEFEQQMLEGVIRDTFGEDAHQDLFNNAGQVWNHTFFWLSMKPGGGGEPDGRARRLIDKHLGGHARFRSSFIDTAVGRFGSGYVWLVLADGKIKVTSTPNAVTPLTGEAVPLLNCDLWEHSYYLDYQNDRGGFIKAFLDHLVDWEMVNIRLAEHLD